MTAQILIVLDDPVFCSDAAKALEAVGYSVATYNDPLTAMVALGAPLTVEVVATAVNFGDGRSNGVALVRMAQFRKETIRAVFVSQPDPELDLDELGVVLPAPAAVPDLVAAVIKELRHLKSVA